MPINLQKLIAAIKRQTFVFEIPPETAKAWPSPIQYERMKSDFHLARTGEDINRQLLATPDCYGLGIESMPRLIRSLGIKPRLTGVDLNDYLTQCARLPITFEELHLIAEAIRGVALTKEGKLSGIGVPVSYKTFALKGAHQELINSMIASRFVYQVDKLAESQVHVGRDAMFLNDLLDLTRCSISQQQLTSHLERCAGMTQNRALQWTDALVSLLKLHPKAAVFDASGPDHQPIEGVDWSRELLSDFTKMLLTVPSTYDGLCRLFSDKFQLTIREGFSLSGSTIRSLLELDRILSLGYDRYDYLDSYVRELTKKSTLTTMADSLCYEQLMKEAICKKDSTPNPSEIRLFPISDCYPLARNQFWGPFPQAGVSQATRPLPGPDTKRLDASRQWAR